MIRSTIFCLVLSGCSLVPGGAQYQAAIDTGTVTAIADVQHFNDLEAMVFTKGLCAMRLGAYARLSEGAIKQGIALICGLQPTTAVLKAAPLETTGSAIVGEPRPLVPQP